MATIWRDTRTRGRPAWCILYKGLDDRWHRERTDAASKEQASRILAQKLGEIAEAKLRGSPSTEALKPLTFEEFVDKEYLPHCKATHTASTYRGNRGFSRSVLPTFGKKLLRSITTGDIQRFVDERAHRVIRYVKGRAGEKVPIIAKAATTNRELMFISGAMKEALRRGYVDLNPATGIRQLPENNDKVRWLTDEEEKRLLGCCPAYLKPIMLTSLHAGMRQGEVLGLRWIDIDFDQRLVRVARSKSHKVRYIPINPTLYELFRGLPHFSGEKGESPYVFTNPKTETRYVDVEHRSGRVARKAGFTDVSFHTLRHTFASRLAQRGVPLNTIRELLGHGTMAMTMRYAHLAPNNLREAVDLLAVDESKPKHDRKAGRENRTPIVQEKPSHDSVENPSLRG